MNLITEPHTTDHPEPAFQFGENWCRFLSRLTEERLQIARQSLVDGIGKHSLQGLRFLDVGCGSGIFSLAARRLGAEVVSFDYDKDSVGCAKILREKYLAQDAQWKIESGSILDATYLQTLGTFDIVYSWGVLHHTGDMKRAFANVSGLANPGGYLFIAIYNDQGWRSRVWHWIKKTYAHSNIFVRGLLLGFAFLRIWPRQFVRDLFKHGNPLYSWQAYSANRGMSAWHDLVDWTGGYPFEVAKPEEVIHTFRDREFDLVHLRTVGGGLGCNEYVFRKKG